MARKLSFILELESGAKLVSQVSDIDVRFKALGKQIKTVEDVLVEYNSATDKQKIAIEAEVGSIEKLETKYASLKAEQIDLRETKKKLNSEIRDQVKLFDNVGKKVPTDSLLGYRREYFKLRKEIDNLSESARELPENLEKIERANKVKEKINEMGAAVGDFREQVGSYEKQITKVFDAFGVGKGGVGGIVSSLIDPLSSILKGGGLDLLGKGGVLGGLQDAAKKGPLGELVSVLGPGGVLATAGAATLIATAGYVSQVTLEFEKLFQKVGQVSGVTGRELVTSTAQIKAISETYGIEFDEILKAANSTSKAFNSDIGKTLGLIQQGLAAGAEFNNEFIDSLKEYPRLVQEAGLSQEQFIEILVRSTKEGIYSDKGIDAVKEGGIRIREQTEATRKALTSAFGKKATDELLDGVKTGAITTFEAMQEVSKGLNEVELTSEQTGAILADVFGGPGEDAGIEFIKSLKDVNGELEDIINVSDTYTKIQNNQYESTLRLAQSQANLASQFAGSGTSLRTLTTDLKAFGTGALDGILLKFRSIGSEFEDQGFLAGLKQIASTANSGGSFGPTAGEVRLRVKDAEALREQTEGEEKAEKLRIIRNKAGANGIAGLREEQQKLTQAIQDAKAKGEPYKNLLTEYETISGKLSEATNVLTNSIKSSKTELAGDVGSLARLGQELSALQDKVNKSGDPSNELLSSVEAKKAEIESANKAIEESTTKGQLKRTKREIELTRDRLLLEAKLTFDNEKLLAEELKKIKIQSDIDILESRKAFAEKGSLELAEFEQKIAAKKDALGGIDSNVDTINRDDALNNAIDISQALANQISKSEEELQLRLSNIQITSQNERLRRRIDDENLVGAERLLIEQQIQDGVDEITANNAQIKADKQTTELDEILVAKLTQLANEVETTEEFEKLKTEIVLEAELERLQIEKDRRLEAGENLLDIEQQIAEKELAIHEQKNADILKGNKKRLDQQKKLDKDLINVQVGALQEIGAAFGKFFAESEKDQEAFAKSVLLSVLTTVEKTINLYLAQLLAKEIASKSFLGIATAGILTGVVKGAFGVAKSAISANERGTILLPEHSRGTITRDMSQLRSHTTDDLKRGTIFQGYSHSSTGEPFSVGGKINEAEYGEAIINKKSTQKFKGVLSYINGYNNWGKKFQEGTLLGEDRGNLIPSSQPLFGNSGITDQQMVKFAETVSEKQTESLTPIVDSIVGRVVVALQEKERLAERVGQAEENGLV